MGQVARKRLVGGELHVLGTLRGGKSLAQSYVKGGKGKRAPHQIAKEKKAPHSEKPKVMGSWRCGKL